MAMFFTLRTFGCKTNQYESQGLREILVAAGWTETDDPAGADVAVVNTCGVTSRAEASCRRAARALVRANPRLTLALVGCGVDLDADWGALPPALRLPNREKASLPKRLEALFSASPRPVPAKRDPLPFRVTGFAGHQRGFVKIQDGCDNHCAYCAVPRARGAPVSRRREDILREAAAMFKSGRRELALTGINIGAWRDGEADLADLARALAALPGAGRLRLGSVEPPHVTERLIQTMAETPAICPHLHLPLQSGDDGLLRAMGRRYDTAFFARLVGRLRLALDRPALTTDVIVGFPGETAATAGRTRAFCESMGFSRTHVFPYSPRPGTPAAGRPGRPDPKEAGAWRDALLADGRARARAFAASLAGAPATALVEKADGRGWLVGYTERYVRVRFRGDARWTGTLAMAPPGSPFLVP
jgi:threonylcarbamoyladenosine tRNA methylthiotransferase MtaB